MNIIELAIKDDAELCSEILNNGRKFQQEQGFVQWTEDYPNIDTVYHDIETEKGYVLKIDGKIAAYMCIDFSGEPDHETILSWLSEVGIRNAGMHLEDIEFLSVEENPDAYISL